LNIRTSLQASSGVYQEVPVTPGRTYRIDGLWKGKRFGDYNWYEVLLIDGPWSMAQADNGGEDVVQPNYMYAYDSNTYGLTDPTFGWIWMHDQNSPPDNQVDWHNRKGLRKATGNTMTVVLKCGASRGMIGASAWFDDLSLVEAWPEEEIVATETHPANQLNLSWHSMDYPDGLYDMRVTVYDAALNEASVTRHDVVKLDPDAPLVATDTADIRKTLQFADPLKESQFAIWNSGVGTLNYCFESNQPWLVPPACGSSSGEEDVVTVAYNVTDMDVGIYHGVLTIIDNPSAPSSPRTALNAPVVIPVTLDLRSVIPDDDLDGDVDQEDFGAMQICLTGELITILPGCEKFDFQKDRDVDKYDVALFQQCFGRPMAYASSNCDDNFP
jgi:hypothetical protein